MKADDIRRAVYDTLINNATLMSVVNDVYSPPVPQPNDPSDGSDFPYVVIADIDIDPLNTKDTNGGMADVTIHSYTRSGGMIDVEDVADRVYLALQRQTLTIAGAHFINCEITAQGEVPGLDGQTQQSIQTFNVMYDQI